MVATEATQYKERVPIVKKNEAKAKPPFQAVDSASSIRFHPLLQAISVYRIHERWNLSHGDGFTRSERRRTLCPAEMRHQQQDKDKSNSTENDEARSNATGALAYRTGPEKQTGNSQHNSAATGDSPSQKTERYKETGSGRRKAESPCYLLVEKSSHRNEGYRQRKGVYPHPERPPSHAIRRTNSHRRSRGAAPGDNRR